jgi:cell division protease FtsH
VRATFQQQLQQMLLTVLALWIPLIPLLFLAQRLVDSRNGNRRAKSSSPNTPRITFADVAGGHACLAQRPHACSPRG